MGGVAAAYFTTLAVISYRWFTGVGEAPPPISFAGATSVFAACGLIAQGNSKFGGTLAWGFTIAAFLSSEINDTTFKQIAGQIPSNLTPDSQIRQTPNGPVHLGGILAKQNSPGT